MVARDMTLSETGRLEPAADSVDLALHMDEETFRAFYDRTARALWCFLSRVAGDRQLADDLLQETYYRFLRAGVTYENDVHRRRYLFQIAANLVRDRHRRLRAEPIRVSHDENDASCSAHADEAGRAERRTDLARAMGRLKPRERAMLWLAYAQGSTHREIADALGVRPASVKLLLFRARRRLARLLGRDPGGRS